MNLACQSMKGLLIGLNLLDLLPLQPKHSFMSVVSGVFFCMCSFPQGTPQRWGRGWVKETASRCLERDVSLSLSLSPPFDLVSDTAYL